MKVLHVYRTYFPDTQGGLEETIRQICMSTQPLSVESEVLTVSGTAEPRQLHRPEATVYRVRRNIEIASCDIGLGAFALFRERIRWADVVHYHAPWPFGDLLALAAPVTRPQIVTYHSDIVRQRFLGLLYRPLMHRFLGRMDAIVATSDRYAASSPVLRRHGDKVRVIPIGLDETAYPTPDPAAVAEVNGRFGEGFFLFVGVLRQYKGLQYLLDAAKGAKFRIVIAGCGPLEEQLHKQAAAQGLTNVHFTGYVTDEMKMALLQACRALVLPSSLRSEAFGVSLLEGAMLSKALLSTELATGTSYINLDGQTGLVVPPADVPALRRALDRLHSSPTESARFGICARQRFERLFRAVLMGESYHHIYRSLVQGSRPVAAK